MRARVTTGFVAAFALLLLVTGASLLLVAHIGARDRVQTLLKATKSELQGDLQNHQIDAREPAQMMRLDAAQFRKSDLLLLVYDERERLVAWSSRHPPRPDEERGWMTTSIPSGGRRIVLAFPWARAARELNRLAWSLFAGALIVLLAVAVGSWVLVGRVLSPIDRLAELARTAPVETARLQAPSEDVEVQRLVGTLNDFLARLRESNRAKDRFYAAASHELRTPLQGLAGFLEIGLARPRERDELVEILREAQGQSKRLVKLTADLLALNQLESAADKPSSEESEMDVADVVERAVAPLEGARAARSLQLALDLPGDAAAEILAPWSHVEMLVRNLVENAHKYAPDGGHIEIAWHEGALRVWNTVAWSDSDQKRARERGLNRLFEPFYRLDASREGQVTGNGLGLAICHAICGANGWKIALRPTREGDEAGLEARVEFKQHTSD